MHTYYKLSLSKKKQTIYIDTRNNKKEPLQLLLQTSKLLNNNNLGCNKKTH